jgi:hypothetical protein
MQSHKDWIAYFRDDASTDGGHELIPSDSRIVAQRNGPRQGGLENLPRGIMDNGLHPDDIVCLLDGDDYLVGTGALDAVANLYRERGCLVSYGQYETGDSPVGHCGAYTRSNFENLRRHGFMASHLKTFRYKAYMEAMRQDPDCSRYTDKHGKFFDMATDVAVMTPLLEVAGFDRVAFNPHVVYHYRMHPGNEHVAGYSRQKECARDALAKPPMTRADL